MATVSVRGVRTHLRQLGAGRDVVMLHGLASSLAFWYLTVAPLIARHARVTVYDLRGHGLSSATPRGYTTGELAEDLLALCDVLGAVRPVLVGHSFGGAVGLHAAALDPARVHGVVLADAFLPVFERGRSWRAAPGPTERRWRELRAHSTVVPEIYEQGLNRLLIASVPVPVVAVYGEHSTCQASLHGLCRCRPATPTRIVPGAGHLFPLREPEPLVAEVRRLVGSLGGRTGRLIGRD
jgi:pimeloyl-ACP methyl ester carboxylesterase